jgi:hypothetical protein
MLLALALFACNGPGGADADGDADGDPFIAILSPEDGDVVCGDPMEVRVEVHGIVLVDPYNPPDPLPEDSGHIDVTLNGQDAVMSKEESFAIPDVGPGEWQLKAELSKSDHTPLEPYAGDFLYVTVAEEACGL